MTPSRQVLIAATLGAVAFVAAVVLAGSFIHTAWIRAHRRPAASSDQAAADSMSPADEEAARKAAEQIDPSMITYHEAGSFPVAFREPRALAVDAEGRIYVGGDRAIIRYSREGEKLGEIALAGEPKCLAVGTLESSDSGSSAIASVPGRPLENTSPSPLVYVGMDDHVEVYDTSGTRFAVWRSLGAEAIFTSIAATDKEVWVADAGNRLVWRFDARGHLLKPVGQPDLAQNCAGLPGHQPLLQRRRGNRRPGVRRQSAAVAGRGIHARRRV